MYQTNMAAAQPQQPQQQQFQQQQPMIIMQPTIAVPPTATYQQQRPLLQQQQQPANLSNSLMSFCCGGCRKNGFANNPQTQLLNPSVSNNYLYQQHFQHLQQPKQQRLQQQQQQASATIPTSSFIPGCGGQQRYVGGTTTNYLMPQSQQQQQSQSQQANIMSPSRNIGAYGTITSSSQQPHHQSQSQYGKQLLSTSSPLNGPYHQQQHGGGGRIVSDMMIITQPEQFRSRISGLTSDVFRQIEQVEQQFDPNSLANIQYSELENRGEMIIRIISPTQLLSQWLDDSIRRFGDCYGQLPSWIQFVEIIKRPGQTLGLYIREGDGLYTMDGVYISRIALESSVYQSGCLRVGDEILAINFVDVSRMSLDDVVLIMSIPRRLILTIRSRPLNAEHMLTNRNIYGTGMSDSCYYDTVAGDIYSRVDDLRLQQQQNNNKPVVVVKQKQQQFTETTTAADLLLDEDDEEEVYQAATAAAEAGLLDDPSTAAAAAVAGLQDPTPAKAAAAVAAVNEIIVRSGSSLELYGGIGGSRPGSSLMMATARQRYRNHRRLFTSDNLADLYQSEMERAEINNNNLYMPGTRRGTLPSGSLITATSATTAAMINQKPLRTPLSSLYHGRLAHHHQQGSSRSRSATGRLMRTSSEQMIYGGGYGLGLHQQQDPVDQIDHFLQRYQSAKQSMRHRPPSSSRIRHHSFDQSAMLRNSYSTQSLLGNSNYLTGSVGIGGSTSTGISQQHGMAIPLPGMAEAVAIARRRYLRGETTNAGDGSGNIFDTGNYSDTEQQKYRARVDHQQHSNNRSNSLPRAPGSGLSGSRHSSSHHHHHHRASSSLSNRLQQLEQLYSSSTTKNPRLSSSIRPHSAMADNYSNKDIIDDDYSTSAELLAQMRRNVHDQRNQYSGQQQRLSSTTRLDSLRASLAESSSSSTEDILGKNNRSLTSSSRTAAAAGGAGGGASSTSAIYETIRKSKMAQDLQQPQSGRLAISGQIMMMNTDDMKTRYSNLQMTKNSTDSSGFHHQNRPPYVDDVLMDQGSVHQRQPQTSAAGAATTTSLIGQISTRPSRILMIDPSGFQQYGPDLHRQQQATMSTGSSSGKLNDGQIAGYSGLLVIHLLGVRGLQFDHLIPAKNIVSSTATAATTKRVLYSVVECDRIYKARTVAVQSHENNNTNFDWDEVFDIDLFDTKEVSFLFYTWDQSLPDLNMRHKQCSKGTIHLPSIPGLITQHVHAFELRLYDTPGAMFYIKLEYHDLTQTFKRSKRSGGGVGGNLRTTNRSSIGGNIGGNEQPLFGVDLETIIQREQSGYSIPIIIKRCCDEIEKRGLYMLGIYRLCGSSLVKRTLRESFEKNSWLADISLENVPDINVITSLLKDYLRELPEPLFNKAMFDMMDDGLSVCVPDDPTGNAKLMFSILECLPKSHRNTVLYLMDHIKLIHINSDRNKMTSQALAICFGPLFSCHDQSDSVYKPIQVFKFLLDIWPRRKGAMNMLKKSDDFNPQSSLMDGGTASLSTTTTIASNIRSPSYRSPMIADSFTTTTSSSVDHPHHHHQQQHLYDSPSDPSSSSYRFQSNILQMDGSPTKLSTALTTATTTTTTSISGTGRLLPSTQNATRTISAYSSATNSISKYKVPAGSTGPLMLNSSNAGVTATTTTAITTTTTSSSRISSIDSILSSSSPYRSRYGTSSMNATSSLDSNNDIRTSTSTTSYRFSTSSDYYSKDSSLIGGGGTTSGGLSSSRSPYLSSSSSSSLQKNQYTDSEVIDQTYKKYLNNPSTTTTTISSSSISDIMITSSTTTATNEGLYSTVNKPSLMSTTKRSLLFEDSNRILNKTNDPLQDDDDDGGGGSLSSIKNLRSSSSYLNDNNDLPSSTTLSSSYHHNHNSPTKPLITGSGPSSTQLYPSRLNNIISSSSNSGSNTMITSSYTTGYSSLSSSLLGRNIDDNSASNPLTTTTTRNDYNTSSSRKIGGGGTTSSTIYSTINDDDSSTTTTMNKIQSIIDHSGDDSMVGTTSTTSYFQQYQTPLISSRHYSSTTTTTNDYPHHRHHQQKHLDDDNVL
ncbi:rho GTPase activating protein at 100F isoform X2 [Dermatophagoides pteronyssinus]|uniref:rho GTPase activating protein at 100F isoform X2 n=1 Tax=Dermatophagoides pteronyssinus TaxID=6956 RepID=UPI003F66BB15